MKPADNCCTGSCLQGRACPLMRQPEEPKTPFHEKFTLWLCAVILVGVCVYAVNYPENQEHGTATQVSEQSGAELEPAPR